MILAEVIADSVNKMGDRITTFRLCYPRYIHSEFMTHRVFSRNAQSSRAVPARSMRRLVRMNPAEPIHWGANQKGMQAYEELTGIRLFIAKWAWAHHKWASIYCNWALEKAGAHKQLGNRLLEAHNHIWVVVTATEWANFLALRDHHAAEPTFQKLAAEIRYQLDNYEPRLLEDGEWHLPFIDEEEFGHNTRTSPGDLLKVSTARCARVSYYSFTDNVYLSGQRLKSKLTDDLRLYEQLVGSAPIHASPAEHQAYADSDVDHQGCKSHLWGNFVGWVQHRKLLVNENIEQSAYKFEQGNSNPDPMVGMSEESTKVYKDLVGSSDQKGIPVKAIGDGDGDRDRDD